MTKLRFDVVGHENGIPVRARSVFEGSAVFTRDKSAAVLVAPDVARQLRTSAGHAFPAEVGGLLVGRHFRDNTGPYVATLGFIQAPVSDGSPGSIRLSAERVAELRQQASRQHPSMDVIGWWHSHSVPSHFSGVDVQSQRLWTQPMHVGLLVFATGKPWAQAYLGPNAAELPLTGGFHVDAANSSSIDGGNLPALPGPVMYTPEGRRRRRPRRPATPRTEFQYLSWLLVFTVVGLVLSVVLLSVAVARLAGI